MGYVGLWEGKGMQGEQGKPQNHSIHVMDDNWNAQYIRKQPRSIKQTYLEFHQTSESH